MSATRTSPANLWKRVVDSHQEFSRAFLDFLANPAGKIEVLRSALRGKERLVALQAVPSLSVEEKKTLFPEWLQLARAAHSPHQIAWSVIEALPREWVLQNIEKEVDAILETGDETDYWMFLQLYTRLDVGLVKNLAQRAAAHADAGIRELGEDYLAMPAVANA